MLFVSVSFGVQRKSYRSANDTKKYLSSQTRTEWSKSVKSGVSAKQLNQATKEWL